MIERQYKKGDKAIVRDHPSDKSRIGTIVTLKEPCVQANDGWLVEEETRYFYREANLFSLDDVEIWQRIVYWMEKL